ncbi:hypothetical protein Tco_1256370 [Tanacetum coccineum]
MVAESNVPRLVDKKGGSYSAITPRLEVSKFNKWMKRMLCYLTGMEPYYLQCIKDGPFQPKTAEGANKHEAHWLNNERRVVNQHQRLKSIIISCLPDDIMEPVISYATTKETWTDLVYSFEGPSNTKENRIMDLKLEDNTFRAKPSECLSQTYTRYKTLLNELSNDGVTLSKHKINVCFVNSLPEKCLSFSQGLRNANHTQTLDLDDIYRRMRNLLMMTQVKVLMALANDELAVGKNHTRNGPVIGCTIEPVITSVPTEVKNNEQDSKINEVTKLVQMLIDEKESKPNVKNTDSSKSVRPKPLQKPKLKCELCYYTNHSTNDCYIILYCMKYKGDDHRTSDHNMYVASLKNSENYKAQPYQYASPSKQIMKAKAKPFPPCTHYGFNYNRPDDCGMYRGCEIYGSNDHAASGYNCVILVKGSVLAKSYHSSESSFGVSCNTCGSTVHSTTDHSDFEHFKKETHQGAHLVPEQWMLKEYDWCQELSAQICREIRMVENQNDLKVKQIRTEFRNSELKSFCDNPSNSDIYTTRIVMENPNHLNEPNEAIPEVNPVVPEPNQVVDIHDPNEMVDIPDDIDLVDYDEEDPEEDPEEEPEEEPEEGVDIKLEDDTELIIPYEVDDDKTPPPGDVSSDSVSSDSEGLYEVGESSSARDSSYVGGLAPWALRRDLETSRARARLTEAELSTNQTEIALLKSKNKIREKERELLNHDLENVERALGNVLERVSVLESGENATLKKRLDETETKLAWARMERDITERSLHESRV